MRNSGFYKDIVYIKKKLARHVHICTEDHLLKEYLFANVGYPLYDWMTVPFARDLDKHHDIYNHRHSSAQRFQWKGPSAS